MWGNKRTARVVVNLDAPVAPGQDVAKAVHREASSMLNYKDPKVQALLKQALGQEDQAGQKVGDREKAARLRTFVHQYIQQKDLSVGLATASEVARTRQGDCTEHAVLLAALLRAAGIPARTATGLLYVNQFLGHESVFGGHMWAQAWLPVREDGGRAWVDVDAMLPNHTFDAAHITLGVSAMSDTKQANDLLGQLPLMSALKIKVIQPATGETAENGRNLKEPNEPEPVKEAQPATP